jgi:hypothetical protein
LPPRQWPHAALGVCGGERAANGLRALLVAPRSRVSEHLHVICLQGDQIRHLLLPEGNGLKVGSVWARRRREGGLDLLDRAPDDERRAVYQRDPGS